MPPSDVALPLTEEEGRRLVADYDTTLRRIEAYDGAIEANALIVDGLKRQVADLKRRIWAHKHPLATLAAVIEADKAGWEAANRVVPATGDGLRDLLVRRMVGARITAKIVPKLLRWQAAHRSRLTPGRLASRRPRAHARAARPARRVRRCARAPGSSSGDGSEPPPASSRQLAALAFAGGNA